MSWAARRWGPVNGRQEMAESAGVPGLEPRLNEPESLVLPITPYPKGKKRFYAFVQRLNIVLSSPAKRKLKSA